MRNSDISGRGFLIVPLDPFGVHAGEQERAMVWRVRQMRLQRFEVQGKEVLMWPETSVV